MKVNVVVAEIKQIVYSDDDSWFINMWYILEPLLKVIQYKIPERVEGLFTVITKRATIHGNEQVLRCRCFRKWASDLKFRSVVQNIQCPAIFLTKLISTTTVAKCNNSDFIDCTAYIHFKKVFKSCRKFSQFWHSIIPMSTELHTV